MIFLTWGRQIVAAGVRRFRCPLCGSKRPLTELLIAYRYWGLFWLCFSWERTWFATCGDCGETRQLPREKIEAILGVPIPPRHRYGLAALGVGFAALWLVVAILVALVPGWE